MGMDEYQSQNLRGPIYPGSLKGKSLIVIKEVLENEETATAFHSGPKSSLPFSHAPTLWGPPKPPTGAGQLDVVWAECCLLKA